MITDLLDRGSMYAKDAACLMMHSEKTVKEHYQLVQKIQSMQKEVYLLLPLKIKLHQVITVYIQLQQCLNVQH